MNNKILAGGGVSVAFLIFFISAAFLYFKQDPRIECHSNLMVVKDDVQLKVLISYSLSGGKGIANVNGVLLKGGIKEGNISRTTTFDYDRDRQVYTLMSVKSIPSSQDNLASELLAEFIPRFYLYNETPLIVMITPQYESGWVFATGKVPSFYCGKT